MSLCTNRHESAASKPLPRSKQARTHPAVEVLDEAYAQDGDVALQEAVPLPQSPQLRAEQNKDVNILISLLSPHNTQS